MKRIEFHEMSRARSRSLFLSLSVELSLGSGSQAPEKPFSQISDHRADRLPKRLGESPWRAQKRRKVKEIK